MDEDMTAPRVRRSPFAEAAVRRRLKEHAELIAEVRYRRAVAEWAEVDDGAFPDRDAITAQAWAELGALCRVLGSWAALEPEQVFPEPKHGWDEWDLW